MWARSIAKLGLVGCILHDYLDPDFVKNYTSPNLLFRTVTGHPTYSPNDRRFFLLRDILRKEHHLNWVMLTDLRDVIVNRNPFEFAEFQMQRNPVPSKNLDVIKAVEWEGGEAVGGRGNRVIDLPLVFVSFGDHHALRTFQHSACPEVDPFFEKRIREVVLREREPTLLAAIWFANRKTLSLVMERMCDIFEKLDPCRNCNTPLSNFLLYTMYQEQSIYLVGGAPYNTHRTKNMPNLVVYHMAAPDNGPYSDWTNPSGSM
eukprot:CAMPEP_0201508966 /NCGR_PEP_ID=MMETSP0161_2-20130828/2150_1 /ASSEMBLY_ACC=CAM_ASM_000251 /TAXON_ID=180227 /ORGANISM="Neoparamoeba aestuarina, Strain SoJaBio B1-5/56/2" /LENGTH=259 /DNA_ID=CAMNT_0047903773 /DNA_START=330 /DNA_END=1109 /DNA_ORIENTATION=+